MTDKIAGTTQSYKAEKSGAESERKHKNNRNNHKSTMAGTEQEKACQVFSQGSNTLSNESKMEMLSEAQERKRGR